MARSPGFPMFTKEAFADALGDWSQRESRTPERKKAEVVIPGCSLGRCHQELCFVESIVAKG